MIEIDNMMYRSMTEASRQLEIPLSTIRTRLKSKHFKNYIVV
jgi:hypothetical protein